MTTTTVTAAPRSGLLPSPRVIAAAVAALLLGTVVPLLGYRLIAGGSSTAASPQSTPALPNAVIHASPTELLPARVTVARGGTVQVTNMGTAPIRLAVRGTKVATTVDAHATSALALTGLRAGHYTLQAQRPDGRPTAVQVAVTVAP